MFHKVVFSLALFSILSVFAGKDDVKKWFFENEYGIRPASTERAKISFVEEETRPSVCQEKSKNSVSSFSSTYKRVRVDYEGPYGKGSFCFHAFIPKSDKPVPVTLLMCNRPGAMPIDVDDNASSSFWPSSWPYFWPSSCSFRNRKVAVWPRALPRPTKSWAYAKPPTSSRKPLGPSPDCSSS